MPRKGGAKYRPSDLKFLYVMGDSPLGYLLSGNYPELQLENASSKCVKNALTVWQVYRSVRNRITALMKRKSRVVRVRVNTYWLIISASWGLLQGGGLSPLLWSVVVTQSETLTLTAVAIALNWSDLNRGNTHLIVREASVIAVSMAPSGAWVTVKMMRYSAWSLAAGSSLRWLSKQGVFALMCSRFLSTISEIIERILCAIEKWCLDGELCQFS